MPETPSKESGPAPSDPSSLSIEQLAKLLGVAATVVRSHVDEGAPVRGDGTLNLLHYAAWLNQRLKESSQATDGTED